MIAFVVPGPNKLEQIPVKSKHNRSSPRNLSPRRRGAGPSAWHSAQAVLDSRLRGNERNRPPAHATPAPLLGDRQLITGVFDGRGQRDDDKRAQRNRRKA